MAEIKNVYIFENGATMVFDVNGQQVPEYQGFVGREEDRERLDKLRQIVPEERWQHRKW